MWHKLKEWNRHRRLRKGKGTYGRQSEAVAVPVNATLSLRVIRADGRVENLGEVAKL
jgi:hypothetical protein